MAAPDVQVAEATLADAAALAPFLRPEDAAEVRASGNLSPLEALQQSLGLSSQAWAVRFDGEVVALFGLAPLEGQTWVGGSSLAVPWALTGRGVAATSRRRRAFWALSRRVFASFARRYTLVQYVDARYGAALRWAARLGFTVEPPRPFGHAGLPFCRIVYRRPPRV